MEKRFSLRWLFVEIATMAIVCAILGKIYRDPGVMPTNDAARLRSK
jgi:hypothetical protein